MARFATRISFSVLEKIFRIETCQTSSTSRDKSSNSTTQYAFQQVLASQRHPARLRLYDCSPRGRPRSRGCCQLWYVSSISTDLRVLKNSFTSLASTPKDFDSVNLEARAPAKCTENGCKCRKGTPQGQYCGVYTYWVLNYGKGGDVEHIYECNPQGGCCDYGVRNSCKL